MASNLFDFAMATIRQARAAGQVPVGMSGIVRQMIGSYEAARAAMSQNVVGSATAAEQELRQMAGDLSRGQDPDERRLQRIAQLIAQIRREGRLSPDRLNMLQVAEDLVAGRMERIYRKPTTAVSDEEDEITLSGRGPVGYDRTAEMAMRETMHRTPGSSNVYSYTYEPELKQGGQKQAVRGGAHGRGGIVYVTFKLWTPGEKKVRVPGQKAEPVVRPNVPGPTYAYYNVLETKYKRFKQAISDDGKGAGVAVWDFLRVRGTIHGHQHPYRLASGGYVPVGSHLGGRLMQEGGVYVPRKATSRGYAARTATAYGVGHRGGTQSQLEPARRGVPNPGTPNRGTPNRGATRT